MERSLFAFIWRYSKRQQIAILGMTVISFPILYMTLELPKWIVNDAISGDDFPKVVLGFELEQIAYLVALCFGFLALVVLNNMVKYVLNIYKGVAGERMLRRLRFMLYNSILRFRLQRFRRVSSGELIPMITAEVEDVGVFIGEAIATPAFQGGTLLVYVTFIFAQDPFLGAAAVSLYPFQAYIIPKLQRRVILKTRERIVNIRVISDRIGETVSAAPDIHSNDTSRYHLADLSDRLFINYRIRLDIFRRKFMIKFINNFLNQLPPFFFYSVGGYLVIKGNLSFGALVAVLAAYKDLASPWKELLQWYQNLANVTVKYQTVVENFDVDDAMPDKILSGRSEAGRAITDTTIRLNGVTVSASGSNPDATDVSLTVEPGQQVAVYGRDGSGRGETLLVMAGLIEPMAGRATLGGKRFDELTKGDISAFIAYVGGEAFLFNDTIRNNIVYSIKTDQQGDGSAEEAEMRRTEAVLTGNALAEISAPWEDIGRAGVEHLGALDDQLANLLAQVGLDADLYRLGLAAYPDADDQDAIAASILKARAEVASRVASDKAWASLVELWRPGTFNNSATLGENTLYALPADPATKVWTAASDERIRDALAKADVLDLLIEQGATVAETMIELFSNTGADASLISDYSFVAPEELSAFEDRLRRYSNKQTLNEDDVRAYVSLAFRVIPGRHRIVSLTPEQENKLIAARDVVHEALKDNPDYVLFDSKRYVSPLSIEENILFGKPRVDRRGASERLDALLRDTLQELGLREPITRAGLNFTVGVGGARLSSTQRRRVALARALVKRPKILIMDTIGDGDPALINRVLHTVGSDTTVIVGTTDPQVAKIMQTVMVMREGRLAVTGQWDSVRGVAIDGEDPELMERQAS